MMPAHTTSVALPPWNDQFCAHIDGPGTFMLTAASNIDGKYHITVVFYAEDGRIVNFEITVISAGVYDFGKNTAVITTDGPGGVGTYNGSIDVLRTMRLDLVEAIMSGTTEANKKPGQDEPDKAILAYLRDNSSAQLCVPESKAAAADSGRNRKAALEAVGLVQAICLSYKDFVETFTESQLKIEPEDEGESVVITSVEGVCGGLPFSYKFGPSDWDSSLEFLRKWYKK